MVYENFRENFPQSITLIFTKLIHTFIGICHIPYGYRNYTVRVREKGWRRKKIIFWEVFFSTFLKKKFENFGNIFF